MKYTFIILILAYTVRLIYIIFQGNDLEYNLIEDELLYWTWAKEKAFSHDGTIEKHLLSERMPGGIFYFRFLIWIFSQNLFAILAAQAFIDTMSCIVLAKSAYYINEKQYNAVLSFSALSPLMIIMSSQILIETIFLFVFVLFLFFLIRSFYTKNMIINLFFSGLFLGLATFIKALTLPIILLTVIPLIFIYIYLKKKIIYILLGLIIFLFSAFIPLLDRIKNNFQIEKTFALTSQTGVHLAYWITPAILIFTKDITRDNAIKIINEEIKNNKEFGKNPYLDSKILFSVSINIIKSINHYKIAYLWTRASFLNLISPSLLLDKKIRNLEHPSFYSISEPLEWIKILLNEKTYHKYFLFILFGSVTSLYLIFSIFIGSIELFKSNKIIFTCSIAYVLYFCLITGPVLSPKYMVPVLPCLFIYQSFTFYWLKRNFLNMIRKN